MDKTEALANFHDWAADEALRGVPVHTSVPAAGTSWCVLPGAIWLPRDGDHWTGNPFVAVVTCSRDAVTRVEVFGDDQLDEALARAAELEPPAGGIVERQVISAIGQRTRLAIVSSGAERHWAVEVLDADGNVESAVTFPIGETDAALDEYHAQVGEREQISDAIDVLLRYVSAVRRADRHDIERLVAERCPMIDHRPLGYGRLDRAGLIKMLLTPATDNDRGLMLLTREITAAGSGGVAAFTRIFLTDEGEYWEAAGGFAVALVHNGRAVRYDLYAEDDLDSALAQAARFEPALGGPDASDLPAGWFYDGTIDPVWLAERGPLEAEAADVALRFVDAVAVADVDALDATLGPDFATDDHRPVGWGPRSREAFLDAVGQRPTTLGTGVAHGEFLLQLGPVALCRYEVTTSAPDTGGEISEAGLGVMVVADGRVRWMELYGEADLAAAVVRTRELARTHQPGAGPINRADRLARRNPELLGGGSDAAIETLAVRMDDWALHRLTSSAGVVTYVTTQWGADGELLSRDEFDSLHDAETHLDHESFGSLEPASAPDPALVEWGRVTRLRDWERAAELLAPEYRATSDQFLQSGGEVTGDQLLAWFALEADRSHSRELVLSELHAASPVGGVVNETDHYIDDAGASFQSGGVALITVRNGLLTSATKRDDDKLPELLDELERLTAEQGGTVVYLSETARALRGGRRSSAEP